MFRSDDRAKNVPGYGLVRFEAMAAIAVLPFLVSLPALAEEEQGYRPPAAEAAPNGVPTPPGAGRQGDQGDGPDGEGRDGARQPDFTPGCPYRDQQLNLVV